MIIIIVIKMKSLIRFAVLLQWMRGAGILFLSPSSSLILLNVTEPHLTGVPLFPSPIDDVFFPLHVASSLLLSFFLIPIPSGAVSSSHTAITPLFTTIFCYPSFFRKRSRRCEKRMLQQDVATSGKEER